MSTGVSAGLETAAEVMSRFLVAEATLGETLERVAELALATVTSADAVGVTLLEGRRRPVTVFSSATLGREVDQAQYDDDTGPCLEAYRRRTVIRIGDTTAPATARWPGYRRAAAAVGVGSTASLPLAAGEQVFGAFNLYARRRFAFEEDEVRQASRFTTHAAVLLANASAYWDAKDLADGLATAMRSRAVIEQAKGKLMAVNDCSPEEAFEMLVSASQRTNLRLRDLAERIVEGKRQPSAGSPSLAQSRH